MYVLYTVTTYCGGWGPGPRISEWKVTLCFQKISFSKRGRATYCNNEVQMLGLDNFIIRAPTSRHVYRGVVYCSSLGWRSGCEISFPKLIVRSVHTVTNRGFESSVYLQIFKEVSFWGFILLTKLLAWRAFVITTYVWVVTWAAIFQHVVVYSSRYSAVPIARQRVMGIVCVTHTEEGTTHSKHGCCNSVIGWVKCIWSKCSIGYICVVCLCVEDRESW